MATNFEQKERMFLQFVDNTQGLDLMILLADALKLENPDIKIMQVWHRKDDNMWTVDFCYRNEKSLRKAGFEIETECSWDSDYDEED